jgi:regulator of Ty1 transposition protein 103
MSFSDEALKAKLSTLNETQDSIVTVSQWIMFHRYERFASDIVSFL